MYGGTNEEEEPHVCVWRDVDGGPGSSCRKMHVYHVFAGTDVALATYGGKVVVLTLTSMVRACACTRPCDRGALGGGGGEEGKVSLSPQLGGGGARVVCVRSRVCSCL